MILIISNTKITFDVIISQIYNNHITDQSKKTLD